jgi:D-alanine transfer protein
VENKNHILHIVAALLAITTSFFIIKTFLVNESFVVPKNSYKHESYYSNFDNNPNAKLDFISALNNKQILLFGSSELTNQGFSNITNRFFTEQLDIPVLAIGHAGNQTFNYACEIGALKQRKSTPSKVVFIISPGWFLGESANGTSVASFLEYINDDMLKKIINNDSIPKELKKAVFEYVERNFDKINFPSTTLKYIYYKQKQSANLFNKLRYSFMTFIYHEWLNREKGIDNNIIGKSAEVHLQDTFQFIAGEPKWDSVISVAHRIEKQKCTNEFGVNDAYYNEYAKGNLPRTTDPIVTPNQELLDLKLLLQVCKEENIDAVFILQALNPHAYSNLDEINPLMNEVKKAIKDKDFYLYDMWQPNKDKYEKGVLTDVMHTGEYGWSLINREVYNHYIKKK